MGDFLKLKFKTSFFVMAVLTALTLGFQNCSSPTTGSNSSTPTIANESGKGTQNQNNGDGYLGKIQDTDWYRTILAPPDRGNMCTKEGNENILSNVQSVILVDNGTFKLTSDSCDIPNLVLETKYIDYQTYNPDFFLYQGVPFENSQSTYSENEATEYFCRDIQENRGMDVIVKLQSDYRNRTITLLKSVRDSQGEWNTPEKYEFVSNIFTFDGRYILKGKNYDLNMSISINVVVETKETMFHNAQIKVTSIDEFSAKCYKMNSSPIPPPIGRIPLKITPAK